MIETEIVCLQQSELQSAQHKTHSSCAGTAHSKQRLQHVGLPAEDYERSEKALESKAEDSKDQSSKLSNPAGSMIAKRRPIR